MYFARSQNRRSCRLVALVLAIVSLWLSSAAVFEHTDDLGAYAILSAAASHRAPAVNPGVATVRDQCLACLWQQAARELPVHSPGIPALLLSTLPGSVALPQALEPKDVPHADLRAPPSDFV